MNEFVPIIHTYTTVDLKMVVNVFIVETEKGVVLIDSATALSSSADIKEIIEYKIKKPLLAILLTHGHPDHYIGAGAIAGNLDIPIISTEGTLNFAKYQDEYKIHTLKKGYGDNFPGERIFPNTIVKDNKICSFDGLNFKIKDYGRAESDSDSTWEILINNVRHVFAGDLIYNKRHGYFRDGHADKWLKILNNMLGDFDHNTVIHPGHGDDCGIEIIYWQRAYIEAFINILKSIYRTNKNLTIKDMELAYDKMLSFLPDETILFLLKYEPEETMNLLIKNKII